MRFSFPFFKKKSGEQLEVKAEDIDIADIIAPSLVEIKQNYLKLGERFCKSFFIFSYPRYLTTGWLAPIINVNFPMDISMHIHPVESGLILKKLRKKVTEVQAEIEEREEKGLIRDPSLQTAYEDIETLRDELQTARERVFRLGLYINIYGDSEQELRETETFLRSIFESRLIYVKPALMREKQGFISCMPYGIDELMVNTPLNTAPLSSIFPFVSPDLSANEGILYGINLHNNSLVLFDRFTLENSNFVIFAKSGSGKSLSKEADVLCKNETGEVQLTKIGLLIDKIIQEQGIDFRDKELEGKTFPGFKVWTFNENMKGKWGEVSIAARKEAPKIFYKFTTKSGREITTTGDHNLVILQNGKIQLIKGDEAKKGDFAPLPKNISIENQSEIRLIDMLSPLKDNQFIYVKGAEKIIAEKYELLKKLSIDKRFDRYLYKYRTDRIIPVSYFWKIKERIGLDLKHEINNLTLVSCQANGAVPALMPISKELLKVLGYIVSEGTITDKFIAISNTDSEFLNDLENCLTKLEILHFRVQNKGINIASRVFVEIVKMLGASGNSANKKVCPFIFSEPKERIAHYLSTYFEGDGGVEKNKSLVSATSKSERLISDISYLLYYFGIVGRISKTTKEAVGSNWKEKRIYWRLTISGQENLKKFAENINFISQRKRKALSSSIQKIGNTNVDFIPDTAPIFKEIYDLFSCGLHRIQDISNIKRGHYNPSPEKVKEMVGVIEERIQQFKNMASTYKVLSDLPSLSEIIDLGKNSKDLNKELWKTLRQSWHVVKYRGVKPRFTNALKMIQIVSGKQYELSNIKQALYSGFQEMDLEIKNYCSSMQGALVVRPASNTRYDMIQKSAQHVWQSYQDILINKLPKVEEKLQTLKVLANSDLFWDPIVGVEKIENKIDKYVYDLTCENSVFLAGRGGMFVHNSYFVKLEILRYLIQGVEIMVVDPENEYVYLTEAVGGSFFKVSLNSDNHLNLFDLPTPREDEDPDDVLRSNIINMVGLFRLMLGGLTAQEDAIIDRAITETYAARDIVPNSDSSLWKERIPLLSDFESVLSSMEGTESLVERLGKYTKGSYANFFNSPTDIKMDKGFTVFGLRDMEDELRPMAMFIILRFIWNSIKASTKKRILLIDEAWWIMQSEDGASFLYGICKRARKYWLGVTTITQDVSDFMKSDYGKPIISNSSLQFLLKQSPAAIELVKETFSLTDEEKNMLLQCDIGEGIFIAGQKRVALKGLASYTEDQIITSSPEELVKIKEAKKQLEN